MERDRRKITERLAAKGVKPTANRILVLEALCAAPHAVSIAELEAMLETVDKSSIFRTLALFVKHHLVHDIEDGSGSMKYEACDSESDCSVADMHTHFFCEACHATYCLKSTQIPVVELPDGFVMHAVNYTIKGLCAKCSKRR